jgi:hypothetical protein
VVTDQRCSEVDEVGFLLPVQLHEDAVDVIDVDGLRTTADGFDHGADAELACLPQLTRSLLNPYVQPIRPLAL